MKYSPNMALQRNKCCRGVFIESNSVQAALLAAELGVSRLAFLPQTAADGRQGRTKPTRLSAVFTWMTRPWSGGAIAGLTALQDG